MSEDDISVGITARYDWYQTDCSVTIIIYTRHVRLRRSDVIIELTASTIESSSPQSLHVCVLVNDHTFRGAHRIFSRGS